MSEIDRYLHGEMHDAERSKFEENFVGDESLFYDIVQSENELVDTYARGELSESERQRFERSLDSHPARKEKLANAKVILEFTASERSEHKTITIAERSAFFSKLGELLSFRSPAFQFASIAAIFLLAFAAIFLLLENQNLKSAQTELASARVREAELAAEIENAQEVSGDLTSELNTERLRIAELESEIARLRSSVPENSTVTVSPSTIAALVLTPVMSRGGVPPPAKRLELEAEVTRVSIVINLPAETGDTVSVRLNGEAVANDVRVRTRQTEKTISVIIPITRIKDQRNTIEITEGAGKPKVEYAFSVVKK